LKLVLKDYKGLLEIPNDYQDYHRISFRTGMIRPILYYEDINYGFSIQRRYSLATPKREEK
jgi:hypothetical protein